MTIGMVVDNELMGDTRVLNEARALIRMGYIVKVLCLNFGTYPARQQVDGITVIRKTLKKKWKDRWFFFINLLPVYNWLWKKWIKSFLKLERVEILHAHDLYMAKPANRARKLYGIPLVIDLHENFPAAIEGYRWAMKFPHRIFTRPQVWRSKEFSYLNLTDGIVALSDHFQGDLIKQYPALKKKSWAVYPNVPDIEKFKGYAINNNLPGKQEYPVIFYFGGIAARRGVFTTFEALRILLRENIKVKLLLIGPVDKAEMPRFKSYLKDKDIEDYIIYHPWRDISELPSFIAASEICLSPIVKNAQHESGIANKVFQYMLFSRPVVVSDCRPQKTLVDKNKCGVSFESKNPDDLAEKIKYLLANPEESRAMGERGRKAILAEFNSNIKAEGLVQLYKELNYK